MLFSENKENVQTSHTLPVRNFFVAKFPIIIFRPISIFSQKFGSENVK